MSITTFRAIREIISCSSLKLPSLTSIGSFTHARTSLAPIEAALPSLTHIEPGTVITDSTDDHND